MNDQLNLVQNQHSTAPQTAKKREFTALETAFAWISLIAGYAFFRLFFVHFYSIGALIFVAAIFLVTAAVLAKKGAKFGFMPCFAAASAIILSLAFFFSSNSFIHFFSCVYAAVSYVYFVYAAFGNSLEKGFSNLFAADYFKALFVMPFASFADVFFAIASTNGKKRGKFLLKILLGIALTFIPTVIVISLLSYDTGFVNILKSIFKFDVWDVMSHIMSAVYGAVVGMYIYGAFISAADKKCENVITARSCHRAAKKARVLPTVTALAASVPLIALYVIFFVSQWKYYVSGFVGELPDSTSYAEYAREGFFQLCGVCVINLIIICAIMLFMRRSEKSVLLRTLSLVFSAFTLALISTAMAKMVLYINRYGLTPKRVYASWFMIVLAVVFLLICAKQFASKFKLAATVFFVSVAMFGMLALSGVDSMIAKYNVDRYIDGSLETIDICALEELGEDALPQIVRLAEHIDKNNNTSLKEEYRNYLINPELYTQMHDSEEHEIYGDILGLLNRYDDKDEQSVFSLTLPRIRSHIALTRSGIIK